MPSGPRQLLPVELDAFITQRYSVVAARPLQAGTVIQTDMLKVKVAPAGVGPHLLGWLCGKKLLFDLPQDSPLTFGVVE
jgi:sialic acid synthase SpsE